MDSKKNEYILPLEVYTDGSLKSIGKTTFGGWSFIVVQDSHILHMNSGHEDSTTNQRMELTAILEALKYVKTIRRSSEKVVVYSDSAYAVNCYLQEWYINWQYNGWVTSTNKEVANQDLWVEIIPFFNDFWYDFRKIAGHSGHEWNERCDQLAQTEAENLKHQWRGYK